MDVRSCEKQGPPREAHRRVVHLVYEILRAPPQRASAEVCFLLTFDLHGCRQSGNWMGCCQVDEKRATRIREEMDILLTAFHRPELNSSAGSRRSIRVWV